MAHAAAAPHWRAPIVGGKPQRRRRARSVTDPADRRRVVGEVMEATQGRRRSRARPRRRTPRRAGTRRRRRARAHDPRGAPPTSMRSDHAALMALVVREARQTIPDALAEVREAVDFCRYYAARARAEFAGAAAAARARPASATRWRLHGRGVFACISPWNFPLAIFTGQVAGGARRRQCGRRQAGRADAADRRARPWRLLHEAGVPGRRAASAAGRRTRRSARRWSPIRASPASPSPARPRPPARSTSALAARGGPIAPLIAETGGINAMIVDSSALPEQVVARHAGLRRSTAPASAARRCACCSCRRTSPTRCSRCSPARWRS